MSLPRIAVTTGDPAGVGPELCLRLLADPATRSFCTPVVYGDLGVLNRVADHLGWPRPHPADILDLKAIDAHAFEPGKVSAACGATAYRYFTRAIDDALAGRVDAIATPPLNKESLHAAGFPYPGHTEILAAKTHAERSCMMLTSDEITCSLVTVHVGYREVPNLLTTARVLDVIELTAAAMERIRGRRPKLLVCGLNPHAGEHGLFGTEDARVVAPAVQRAAAEGIACQGPIPADTVFVRASRGEWDAVVSLYHDQGQIAMKLLGFDRGVVLFMGAGFPITTPAHGSALDIAGRGLARPDATLAAIELAARLATTDMTTTPAAGVAR